jgi:UDP-perosamine 4-acetyltransferase
MKPSLSPVIGLGAGGHARVVIEILRLMGSYEVLGLLDKNQELWGTSVLGATVLKDDSLLAEMFERGVREAFIGVGSVGATHARRRLFDMARARGFEMVRAIHPAAVVSSSAEIGEGPTVMASAVINAAARLGDNVIVNTGAIVEHDCVIGHHVHIATGACLAGEVRVDEGTHVGLGARILQGVRIGRNAVVGAGAVVLRDVPDEVVVVGVPARVHRRIEA